MLCAITRHAEIVPMTNPDNTFTIRPARPSDVDAIFKVRTSVQENAVTYEELNEIGVTPAFVTQAIAANACTWVAEVDDEVVGFAMIDIESGCLFAVFVSPGHEGKGIGSCLIDVCERALFKEHEMIWLETENASRAAGLYRHLGWRRTMNIGNGDVRLEKRRD